MGEQIGGEAGRRQPTTFSQPAVTLSVGLWLALSVRVLVTGATGYIGGRLAPRLLKASHSVCCLARDAQRLTGRFSGAEVVEGDIFDGEHLREAFEGVEAAYYLVHSMSDSHRFAERDREAAALFGKSARGVGVQRIIYLGGLGATARHSPTTSLAAMKWATSCGQVASRLLNFVLP